MGVVALAANGVVALAAGGVVALAAGGVAETDPLGLGWDTVPPVL